MKTISETNWEYVDSLTEEQIDTSDIPPIDEKMFRRAQVSQPSLDRIMLLQVDADTLAWYDAQGENKPENILAALREYAQDGRRNRKTA